MLRLKAIILLVVFLFSNIGTATVFHYCEGELTDFALLGAPSCCCVQAETYDCCEADEFIALEHLDCEHSAHSEHAQIGHSDCCQTKVLDSPSSKLMLDNFSAAHPVVTIFLLANFTLFNQTLTDKKNVCFEHPVLLLSCSKSKQILFQSFLI